MLYNVKLEAKKLFIYAKEGFRFYISYGLKIGQNFEI